MFIHLEMGACSSGWNIQHINALVSEDDDALPLLIRKREPRFLAGAPRKFVLDEDFSQEFGWVCPLCQGQFCDGPDVDTHLRKQECSQGYSYILKCPVCPDIFIKVSALLEHVSAPRCAATRTTSSIAALLKAVETGLKAPGTQEKLAEFRYQLEPDPDWPGKLNFRVAEMD
ncbi:hypothetical protein OEA41_004118 [Lepraria neglecta]|uniref:C2H2-type domain-containing protein n=1 Tax=Lepraria neglecta TaxID=209136 RepID=A0AAD9Z5I1_9LECA|nr:hypothetical protein OEA41_004118 [Lepraria neglecta]